MPKLPDVPSVIRVRWIGSDAADTDVGSHFTMRYGGSAPSSAALGTQAALWGTNWATNVAPLVSTDYTLTVIEAIDLSSSTAAVTETSMSHPGTRAGTPLPLNCAVTAGFVTALRRRGGHWHAQVRAGVQADLANSQTWSGTFLSAFQTGFLNWIAYVTNNLWSGATSASVVGVQYYGPPNVVRTSASGRVKTVSSLLAVPVVYPVTGYSFRARIGSQRRRLG